MKNQFDKNVKVFQSDGGGKFEDKNFCAYLCVYGIKHKKSCSRTSKQNGVAKKKHKNITELGLTMMFTRMSPKDFGWKCLVQQHG